MSPARRLHVSNDLSLPLDWMSLSTVVYGARGSGKTTLGSVIAEELHAAGQRFCAVDVKGDWWGLKSSVDGKDEGLPVVIFGGDHADLPLEPDAGAYIAELIADLEYPAIIDLEHFSKGKQIRFLGQFFERLYDKNREPITLFLDEAQRYAPQNISKGVGPDAAICLGAVEDLVKLGRKHGIGPMVFTQRGSGLNKEVSELCDMLVAFRTPGPLDQKRVREWLEANATAEERDEVMTQISGLDTGTAIFRSAHPSLKLFAVARVRERETFDSSATPRIGHRAIEPRRLSKPDIPALTKRMEAAIERARGDDPRVLRNRLRDAERALQEAQKTLSEPVIQTVEVPVFTEADRQILEAIRDDFEHLTDQVQIGLTGVNGIISDAAERARHPLQTVAPARFVTPAVPKPAPRVNSGTRDVTPRVTPASSNGQKLAKAERAILTVLAQYQTRTKRQTAVVTGYAMGGGGFNNALSSLRSKGYLIGSDPISITQEGMDAIADDFEPLPTGPALVEYWKAKLGKAERAILDQLMANPRGLLKEDLAELTGYAAGGGGFNNALSRLRTLELANGRDVIEASEDLR